MSSKDVRRWFKQVLAQSIILGSILFTVLALAHVYSSEIIGLLSGGG